MNILDRFYDKNLWECRNRPTTVSEIILPDRIKNMFLSIENLNDVGNLLLTGPKGSGKTTLAACIASNSKRETLYVNMSLDKGIATIRENIISFMSNVGFDERKKIVIGDEFDQLSLDAKDSLKSTIETFSPYVNFIFITNHKTKLTEELIDRLTEIEFVFSKQESVQMKKELFKRVCLFLKNENIEFHQEAVGELIQLTFPSMRKVWIKLQQLYKIHGSISKDCIKNAIVSDLNELIKYIKAKDYVEIKKYIMNQSIDLQSFYQLIFNNIENYVSLESLGEAITIIEKYQTNSYFSIDKNIPLSAMCVSLSTLKFK